MSYYVVYPTDEAGGLERAPEEGSATLYSTRKAASAAARGLVADGATGAIVVQDGSILARFGKVSIGKQG